MAATVIGALFALAVLAGGVGTARRLSAETPPLALGGVVALAAGVVLGANVAATWRFEPSVQAGAWAILLADSLWSSRRGSPWRGALRTFARSPLSRVLSVTALALVGPMLVLPVPLDTDAQGFGMLALAMRDGGTIDTLAPWRPDIGYLYAPGALLIFATVSAQARSASMPSVMMGVSHASVWLFVWLAWELGRELAYRPRLTHGDPQAGPFEPDAWPWAMSLSAALSVGLWAALLDSHYTAVLGLLFVLGFVTALLRYLRTGRGWDLAAAAVVLAAVPVTHADSAMVLAFGLGASCVVGWLGRDGPGPRRWAAGVLVPLVAAVVLTAPWLVSIRPLLETGIRSPYTVSLDHWRVLVLLHGLVWPALALLGAIVWIRRGRWWAIVMAGWLVAVVESSTLGWVERAVPELGQRVLRFNYPFSVAWHGPVIPYMVLGAGGLLWMLPRLGLPGPRRAPGWLGVAIVGGGIGLGVASAAPLLTLSRHAFTFHGAFASANDLRAMRWVREHAAPDARVLNYPGDHEGRREWEAHWAPVVTERDCVYFRMQPFFLDRRDAEPGRKSGARGLAGTLAEQQALLAFWRDPADPSHGGRLREAGLRYVLVPESIGDPASLDQAWRWQPAPQLRGIRSTPDRARYLRLAYRAGGARVYEVMPADDAASSRPEP
jgi:hypothetical protein